MENTTHTPTEIAKAIMSRAGLRTPPYAVDLPLIVCPECNGEGYFERTVRWRRERWACGTCFGVGEAQQVCDLCKAPATHLDIDGKWTLPLCEKCATEGDDVVSFALRVMP